MANWIFYIIFSVFHRVLFDLFVLILETEVYITFKIIFQKIILRYIFQKLRLVNGKRDSSVWRAILYGEVILKINVIRFSSIDILPSISIETDIFLHKLPFKYKLFRIY